MNLLLDLGNTRLKAGLQAPEGRIVILGEARHADAGIAAALAQVLPDGALPRGTATALCANVAGEAAGHSLAGALRARGITLSFLRPCAEALGVRCAYAEPTRLGADRWAALLGARGMTGGACLVVDAGSALTIDAMAPGGEHLGGWIIPGLTMMVAALEARTGDLAALRRASVRARTAFPADTGPAMEEGALLAAAGSVGTAAARLAAHCGGPPRMFVTGGDALSMLDALGQSGEHVPDLVLRGLARAEAGLIARDDNLNVP
jgi:type III pantothenate kinase